MVDELRIHTIYSSSSAIRRAVGVADDVVHEGAAMHLARPFVVQIHGRRTHQSAPVIRVLRDLHTEVGRLSTADADAVATAALRGCPFVVGAGETGAGETVVFSVAYDVRADGLVALDDITSDVGRLRAYRALPLEHRLANGQALAGAYEQLERLRFVHGDLRGAHVFVRVRVPVPGTTTHTDAVVVGFQHGAVRAIRSGRHAERGQFAALLHRAVLGVGPAGAAAVRADLLQLPEPTADALRGALPLTGRQWREALSAAGTSPEFRELVVSPRGVIAGEQVTVRWRAIPAREVSVAGWRGALPAEGEIQVTARTSGPIRVTAVNAFGRTETWTDTVRVFTPPTIAAVRIPRVPPIVINAPVVRAPLPELDLSAHELADAVTRALRGRINVDLPALPRDARLRASF